MCVKYKYNLNFAPPGRPDGKDMVYVYTASVCVCVCLRECVSAGSVDVYMCVQERYGTCVRKKYGVSVYIYAYHQRRGQHRGHKLASRCVLILLQIVMHEYSTYRRYSI
jgi:hypothetical protein